MPGLFIACFLPADQVQQLAVDGGEPVESLHITLAALGDPASLPDDALETAQRICMAAACTYAPLAGVSAGFGVFRAPDKDCFWACVDVPGLACLREQLCQALCDAGLEPLTDHGWCPHITLAYLQPGTTVSIAPEAEVPLQLGTIAACLQDDDPADRQDFPLLGSCVLKEQPSASAVHVDAPLGSKSKNRKPVQTDPDDEISVDVIKADDERQIVTGIVLQPTIADTQGDIVTKEDIELAAHRFLYGKTPIGIQHQELAPADVRPVESFIAPVDYHVETPRGRELVAKGSWIVAAHVPDKQLWERVKNEFTGWSIAGTGRRIPIPA